MLSQEPHVAGTPAEKKVADYVLARFKEFGIDAEMVRYDVFLNHPKHVSLRIVSPVEEELKLREEPYDVDKDSTQEGMFPGFHGYGASGKAEGEVVYVKKKVVAAKDDDKKSDKKADDKDAWMKFFDRRVVTTGAPTIDHGTSIVTASPATARAQASRLRARA